MTRSDCRVITISELNLVRLASCRQCNTLPGGIREIYSLSLIVV